MNAEAYESGEYLTVHPTWHVEDSAWKANKVLGLLRRNSIHPETITEVGSGAGGILAELQKELDPACHLSGYEISPQAHELAQTRQNDRLKFYLADYLSAGRCDESDLLLLMDVVEHVPDDQAFLQALRSRSRWTLIHVPLDLSAQSILRQTPEKVRQTAGHVHYYTKDLFLAVLKDAGYEVIDWTYTGAATERPASSLAMAIAKWPRQILYYLSPDFAARLLGGFSLLILAQPKLQSTVSA